MERAHVSRRSFLGAMSAGVGLLAAQTARVYAGRERPERAGEPVNPADASLIRLATVLTPDESGLLHSLLSDFRQESGYTVELYSGMDLYDRARAGSADLLISHYGFRGIEDFVLGGWGRWPRAVFANQVALLGPPADPAVVDGLSDVAEAYRRIAVTRSPYVMNQSVNLRYLDQTVWNAAGRPERGSWLLDEQVGEAAAVRLAAEHGAYVFWGVTPYLALRASEALPLEPMVLADPLLQRPMVTIVVNDTAVAGINTAGALALEDYLLEPAIQAAVRTYRVDGIERQLWWPVGRANDPALLASLLER